MAKSDVSKFSLSVTLGNAAMCSSRDLANALENVAKRIRKDDSVSRLGDSGKVMDANGNSCGSWSLE